MPGAQTSDPKIKSHLLYRLGQPGTLVSNLEEVSSYQGDKKNEALPLARMR